MSGKIIEPKKPDMVKEVLEQLDSITDEHIVRWVAEVVGTSPTEAKGLLASGTYQIGVQSLGQRRVRVSLYKKMASTEFSTEVKVVPQDQPPIRPVSEHEA